MAVSGAVRKGTYRLSEIVRRPGGRSDAELVQRAEVKLSSLKAKLLAPFDAALAEVTQAATAPDLDVEQLYRRALTIAELGALVGQADVGRVSVLLCDWMQLAANNQPILRRGVNLHVDAMRAVRRETTTSAVRVALLKELESFAQRQRPLLSRG